MNVTLMLTVLSCMALAGAKADNPGRQLHRDNSPPSTVTKPFGPFLAASKKRDYARQLRRESIIGDIVGNIGSILNNLTPEPTPEPTDEPDEVELLRRRRVP
ncbi:hypothetical protein JG687_00008731 [Phytophthora cactorum]|uniref:RxLR effector protein n=1 Tax=Phytophthora cactorum TaxID=29920 RepID=A0A8T1UD26_9STRA|nr:hypothetical protein PC120_g13193 [Phytophthora cactorum]KAG3057928.1 hypothetical protein PC121_g14619 [Phytophthora cactorum]KAG4050439.1 hypothetical protein PC123_g14332 [Phytophthora cactorum]KAG6959542.1 hypothetical protein JG687_00008731 [Phytophthora cactorum]